MLEMSRRKALHLVLAATLVPLAGAIAPHARAETTRPVIEVTRSPSCACCGGWIEHMRAEGFIVKDILVDDPWTLKEELGVPVDLFSCHTGQIEGYLVEGHVPAEDVKRLLSERPQGRGIAVAGMPLGSPGMEAGGASEPYEVILFGDAGTQVFARH